MSDTAAGSVVLDVSGLRKTFGDLVAVDGVDVRIGPTETYGLLGPNGAGKTTTISMIAGLLDARLGRHAPGGEPVPRDVHLTRVRFEGFSQATESIDQAPELEVVGSVDDPLAAQIAQAVAEGFADRVDAIRLSVATALAEGEGTDDVDALVADAQEQSPPVALDEDTAAERQLDNRSYVVAGVSVLFLFFMVQFGVRGLLEERDQGTLPRLLAAPVPRFVVPLAKAMVSVVLGLVALTVLAVGSTLVLGADWGDPLAVAVLSVAVVLAAISIMGIVVAVARTAEQADNAQTIIAMVLGVLGGSFFPVGLDDGLLAKLSVLTPHHWYLEGLGEASAGGVGDVLGPASALLAFAVVVGGIGAVLVARRSAAGWS